MSTSRTRPTCPSTAQGFSLVELMVVLAILAIVVAIAVPNYQSSVLSSRKSAAANQLLGALQLARSEAKLQREEVRVCGSSNGASCDSDWSAGKGIVLVKSNNKVLRNIDAAKDITVTGATIEFKADGTTTAATLSVGPAPNKVISVNIIGMAKID